MMDHDLAILLTKVREHSIPIAGPQAGQLLQAVPSEDLKRALLDTVAQWNTPDDWADEEKHIILALARIWYTAVTGGITPKAQAAAWLLERLEPPYRPVLNKARAIYIGCAEDDLARCPTDVEAFITRARNAIEGICRQGRGHDSKRP